MVNTKTEKNAVFAFFLINLFYIFLPSGILITLNFVTKWGINTEIQEAQSF